VKSQSDFAHLRQRAELFARAAGEVTLRYFGGRVSAESKGDGSPVTVADREAELLLRKLILTEFPHHGVLGEEFGESEGSESIRWILDPIDGTRSFMRGTPLYAVLIGIEVDGSPVVGVAHFPAMNGEMVSASRGGGCWWNGAPARVSGVSALEDAALLTTDPERILASPGSGPGWRRLSRRAGLVRSWGDAWGHALVATGRAEVMVDPILSPWDAAPLLTILEEAGGTFTDLSGSATTHGGSGVSSNGLLHAEVLRELGAG